MEKKRPPPPRPLPDIKIGQQIKAKSTSQRVNQRLKRIGTVVSINWKHKWFCVKWEPGGWVEMIWMDSNDYSIDWKVKKP